MRETPQRFAITARFNKSKASTSPLGVLVFSQCEKKKKKKQEMIICMCTFIIILTSIRRTSKKSQQHHIFQRAERGNVFLCVEIKYDNCSCNSDTLQRINQSEQFNKIIAKLVLCNVLGRCRSIQTNNARRQLLCRAREHKPKVCSKTLSLSQNFCCNRSGVYII